MKIIRFVLLVFAVSIFAQLLDLPESIVYDEARDRYLVSNFGDSSIVQVDSDGEMSYFSTELTRIAGLHIKDNTLYVAANDEPYIGIVGFDLESAEMNFYINLPAELPNDIATDTSGNLFVTDYWGSQLFKINLEDSTYSLFWNTDFNMPNGIIFDPRFNRLIITSLNEPPTYPLRSLFLADSTIEVLRNTFMGIDGLAFDLDYRLYFSNWESNSIFFHNSDFVGARQTFSSGHCSPADIYFDPVNELICVPNFGDSTLEFIPVMREGLCENKITKLELQTYPNPFNSSINIICNDDSDKIEIIDIKGKVIKTIETSDKRQTYTWQPMADIPSGVYTIRTGKARKSQTMIYLK